MLPVDNRVWVRWEGDARVAWTEDGLVRWRWDCALRKEALEPLRDALRRERWTVTALSAEIARRVDIAIKRPTLSSYLNGRAHWPERVLWVTCKIAGVDETDVLARVDDDSVLVQRARGAKKTRRGNKNRKRAKE